jgi:putative flavoprotein involved in K+ transport
MLIGSSPQALRHRRGVQLHPRAVQAEGTKLNFSDYTSIDVRSVIWATGFGVDHSWIDVPVLDEEGRPLHQRGVTGSPGLYFLGLAWQHTRGSALLGWVKDDAEYIAQQIAQFRPNARAEAGGTRVRSKTAGPTPA